jgi:chitodextrinase
MLKKLFNTLLAGLLAIGSYAVLPTENASAASASNKMLFLYVGRVDQSEDFSREVVPCPENSGKKCYPKYENSDLEYLMAKRGVFRGKEGVHDFVILGDNAVKATSPAELAKKRPYSHDEELKLFPQAMTDLAKQVISVDSSAKVWFSLPGRGSSNGSSEFDAAHFKNVMKAIRDRMPDSQWNNNVQGFYMNIESVYAWNNDPSKTKDLFRQVASEISTKYSGKKLLWAPYYNSRSTAGMNNLKWMADMLSEPVFDIVLLQPNYYFDNNKDDKDLKAVFKSVEKNRLYYPDGINPVGSKSTNSKTVIGAVMEVDGGINNASTGMAKLNLYKEYVKGLQAYVGVKPFVFYSGGRVSLFTGGPEIPTNKIQSNPWQVHQYMLDFYNGTVFAEKPGTSDKEAPSKPGNFKASDVTQNSLTLSWSASTDNVGVTGYEISKDGSLIGTTTSTSYPVSGLLAGRSYRFSVVAKDKAGNTSSAAEVTVTTQAAGDTEKPSKPGNLKASDVKQNSLTLSWSASTDNVGVTGYEISKDGSLLGTTTSTSYPVSGLLAGRSYKFSVVAKDKAGNTSSAAEVTVTTQAAGDTQKPTKPGNLKAYDITETSAKVSWSASSDNVGVVKYVVYLDGAYYNETTSSTSMTISGLSKGRSYTVEVVARDKAGNESDEASVSFKTLAGDTQKPSKPGNLKAYDITETSAKVSWSASSDNVGVVKYVVYLDGDYYNETTSATSMTISGLSKGRSYTVEVVARDKAGNESDEASVSFKTLAGDTQKPSKPGNFTAYDIQKNSVKLSWSASSDNVGVVKYVVKKDGSYYNETSSATSMTVTGLSPGRTYTFTVVASDKAGNVSDAATVTVTTKK